MSKMSGETVCKVLENQGSVQMSSLYEISGQ